MYSGKLQLFVYDIDREGGVLMHWCDMVGDNIRCVPSLNIYPVDFWHTMKRMHVLKDHVVTKRVDNEYGEVWTVEVGAGDHRVMNMALQYAIELLAMERAVEVERLDRLEDITGSN